MLLNVVNIGADIEIRSIEDGCYDTNLNEDFILENISSYDW